MTSSELTRQLGDLPEAAQDHLERLMGSWGMLADLSFSDLVLYVPVAEEPPGRAPEHFVVLGQMRPTTSQTLFESDLVGEVAEEA